MQSLDIVQMRWIFLMLGSGLGLVLLILLGFYGRSLREPPPQEAAQASPEAGYRAPRAVPWFLILLYLGMGAFIVGYVFWVAYGHVNI